MTETMNAPEIGEDSSMQGTRSASERGWPAVLAVFLCGTFAFVDLYCTQPLLPLLERMFHATEAQVGVTISASTVGVAISAALLAIFAEQVNRKRMIVGAMGMLAFCTLMAATASGLPSLAVWRVLQGLVTPGVFILTIAYITEEWPALRVPRVMSVYVAGTVFGGFLGRLSGGLIGARFGWRPVFVTLGLFGFAGMALTQWLLVPAHAPRTSLKRSLGEYFGPVRRNIRNPALLATFGVGFSMLFTLVAVFSYVTFYLTAAPFLLSTEQVSWLFAVYLFGLVATLAMGAVLVRIGLRPGMLIAVSLCVAGAVLTMVPTIWFVAAGLALTGAGVFIAQTCANSFLRDAAPEGHRVAAAGMYICSYYIGGTAGGVLPGMLWRHGGWTMCVGLTCAVLVMGGVFTFFGWRTRVPEPIPVG